MFTKTYPKTLLLLTIGLVLALVTSGCGINLNFRTVRGSGVLAEQTYPVHGFHAISLTGMGEVTIEIGAQESLQIEAEDNLLEYFTVEVVNGVLEIGLQERTSILPTKSITLSITAQSLDALTLSGLGSFAAPELSGENCKLAISGSGNMKIQTVDCTSLDASVAGMGDITVEDGQVNGQEITISGMGDYEAGDLQSDETNVTISGMGDVTVWATDLLDVRISGTGRVDYYGSPSTSFHESGVGHINHLGEK